MDKDAIRYNCFLNGDDSALCEIVKDHKDGLIFFINGYVNNIYLAEELMEETFFKIIVKRPKFNEKYSFKTYLYTVGRNVAIDYIRHNSKQSDLSISDIEGVLSDESDLENMYIAEERKSVLYKALKELKDEYRHVLYLIYFENFSHTDAGKIMKKNARQMKNLVYRAKNALKNELIKEGFVYEEL